MMLCLFTSFNTEAEVDPYCTTDLHRDISGFLLKYLLSCRDELMWISPECPGGKSSDTHPRSTQTWTHPHLCSFVRGFNDVPLHSSPNSVPLWLVWWPLPCADMLLHTHREWMFKCTNLFFNVRANKQTNKGRRQAQKMHTYKCTYILAARTLQVNWTHKLRSGWSLFKVLVWCLLYEGPPTKESLELWFVGWKGP